MAKGVQTDTGYWRMMVGHGLVDDVWCSWVEGFGYAVTCYVADGWQKSYPMPLRSARGQLRHFKTADAALRAVRQTGWQQEVVVR